MWIILDRDGTIIEEKNYLCDPEAAKLLPYVGEGLSMLSEAGFKFIVITNQSGIGRGYYTIREANAVNARVSELLKRGGVEIEAFYCCPHRLDEKCSCRKPAPALVFQAARDLGFETKDICCVIGDKECDVKLAENLGVVSVLLATGYGAEERARGVRADLHAGDMAQAARIIIEKFGGR